LVTLGEHLFSLAAPFSVSEPSLKIPGGQCHNYPLPACAISAPCSCCARSSAR
jgi:hypothetical protein